MRLDKCLERAGIGSRKDIKRHFKAGRIRIDGRRPTQLNQIVDLGFQEITVAGQQVVGEGEVYYLLHKPAGVVSAVSDKQFQTVVDLIAVADRREGLYPLGRLDRDTEGLVLLTTNGPLGFRLLHPQHHVEKVYEVEVNGLLGPDAVTFFQEGVVFLDGTVCQPAVLEILETSAQSSKALIRIREGKFHQVKKMFLAYGVKVTYLKRVAFADLELGDLAKGQYRSLTQAELRQLASYFEG